MQVLKPFTQVLQNFPTGTDTVTTLTKSSFKLMSHTRTHTPPQTTVALDYIMIFNVDVLCTGPTTKKKTSEIVKCPNKSWILPQSKEK